MPHGARAPPAYPCGRFQGPGNENTPVRTAHETIRYRRPVARLAVRRRRAAAAAAAAAVVVVTLTAAGPSPEPARQIVRLRVLGQAAVPARIRDSAGQLLAPSVVARSLPARARIRAGAATMVRVIDRDQAAARALAAPTATVAVPSVGRSASIDAPVVAQRLRNNCETAALEVLLATVGVRVDQLTLQRQITRSGPLDPQGPSAAPVWGDPDRGYVGRVDGTGPWGGFGVYPTPIRRLAARHGLRLRDVSGAPAAAIYQRLLAGHAVMVWVGLADGPYRTWTSPQGRPVSVNLNEHTVVLNGIRADGSLELVNVLQGTREVWSQERFEQAWSLMGDRALTAT